MRYIVFISILFIGSTLKTQIVTYNTTQSGDWDNSANWTPAATFPSASNHNARILSGHSIAVDDTEICRNLNVMGTLNTSSGHIEVNNKMILSTDGTLNITGGYITADSDLDYQGDLNISNTASYLEISGDIYVDTTLHLQTNDGSIRIYSELDF